MPPSTRGADAHEARTVSALESGRLQSVDALRAVAALGVLLLHSPEVGFVPLRALQTIGGSGVGLFLVISGFAIHFVWAARGDAEAFSSRRFFRRRFFRLYPTYLAAVVVAAVVAAALGAAVGDWHQEFGLTGTTFSWPVLAASQVVLVVANVVPTPLIAVSWTLALEAQLYAAYAAFVRRARRIGAWRLVGVSLIVALAWRFGVEAITTSVPADQFLPGDRVTHESRFFYAQLPSRWFEWMLGFAAAEAWFGHARLPRWCTRLPVAIALLAAAAAMFRHPLGPLELSGNPFKVSDVLLDPLFGVGFFVLLNWAIRTETAVRPSAAGAALWRYTVLPLAYLGLFSYSLYLLHPTLLTLFGEVVPLPASGRLGWFAACWCFVLLGAWALFRTVESRFIRS